MQLTLRYARNGETHEVTTSIGVIIAWEKQFKTKAPQLAQAVGLEDLAFLAFEASKRAKIVVPAEFQKFYDSLDDIEVVDSDPENPTTAAP